MKLKRCLLLGRKAMTNLVKVLATQLCTTLCNPVDCRPPGSSVHGILSARILEWVPIPFSRGSSEPREWIWVSCTAVRFSTIWATREVHEKPRQHIKKLRHHSGNKGRMWFFHWSCTDVKVGPWKKLSAEELMLLNCGAGEESWESLGLHGDPTSQSYRKSILNIHWKNWCWSWSSNTLATSCEEATYWKRSWWWWRLRARGEESNRQRMVGWHHQRSGHEFGQTQADSEGQGSMLCCHPWIRRVGHNWETWTTEQYYFQNNDM